MHLVLKIIKGTFSFIVNTFIWLILGAGLALLAFTTQFTDRETVKSWPVRAETYENLVDTFPELIAEQTSEEGEETLQDMLDQSGLDQEALFDSINEILPPEFLQAQIENAIDAIYDYLENETDKLEFVIALSERSDDLVRVLKDQLITQINAYPACTQQQIAELVGEDFDPFRANCIPPGISVTKDVGRFIDDFTIGEEGDEIIEDLVVSENSIESGADGILPTLNNNADDIQNWFALAQNLQFYILLSLLVLGFLSVMLAKSIMHGLRKLGLIMAGQGFTTAILFWLFPRLSDVAIGTVEGGEDNEMPEAVMDNLIQPLFDTIFGDIGRAGVSFGLLAGFTGVLIWLGVYTWHKIHHHPQDSHAPKEHRYAAEDDDSDAAGETKSEKSKKLPKNQPTKKS